MFIYNCNLPRFFFFGKGQTSLSHSPISRYMQHLHDESIIDCVLNVWSIAKSQQPWYYVEMTGVIRKWIPAPLWLKKKKITEGPIFVPSINLAQSAFFFFFCGFKDRCREKGASAPMWEWTQLTCSRANESGSDYLNSPLRRYAHSPWQCKSRSRFELMWKIEAHKLYF